jgi:hypothetical protein
MKEEVTLSKCCHSFCYLDFPEGKPRRDRCSKCKKVCKSSNWISKDGKDEFQLKVSVDGTNLRDLLQGEMWEVVGVAYIILSYQIGGWFSQVLFYYGIMSIVLGMIKQMTSRIKEKLEQKL